ncbi:MAG TPA: hypothetical protein VIL00_05245 [Pseudonocardiaceae bacterium]
MPLGLPRIGKSGSGKPGPKGGRHRNAPPENPEAVPDRELESYLAALAPESDAETTNTGRRFGNAQVYQLRLPLKANQHLRQLAQELQTSPLALATEWIIQRLEQETQQSRADWKTVPNLRPVADEDPEQWGVPDHVAEWETAEHDWRIP